MRPYRTCYLAAIADALVYHKVNICCSKGDSGVVDEPSDILRQGLCSYRSIDL